MLWIYFIIVYSIPFIGFFGLWQGINMFYVFFILSKSNLVDGYFSYKPDVVQKNTVYECVWIYWKNSLRYLFCIERPYMPWYMKINVVFCGLGIVLTIWGVLLVFLDEYLLSFDINELMRTVKDESLF